MHDLEHEPLHPLPRRAGDAPAPASAAQRAGAPLSVARTPATDAASLLELQRLAGNAGVVQLLAADDEERSPVHDVVGKGGGQALDPRTKASMEQAFGDRFDDVRIHTGPEASRSAQSVAADAYTVGNDIVLREGHGPGTPGFQRTVAHELTHVQQQRSGPVDGTAAAGGIRVSDPSDRFERAATANADRVLANVQTLPAEDAGVAVPAVQRQSATDEEEEMALS